MKTPKTSYKATFKDGTVVTRKSHREYTHAWRIHLTVVRDGITKERVDTGFSSSHRLAATHKIRGNLVVSQSLEVAEAVRA